MSTNVKIDEHDLDVKVKYVQSMKLYNPWMNANLFTPNIENLQSNQENTTRRINK